MVMKDYKVHVFALSDCFSESIEIMCFSLFRVSSAADLQFRIRDILKDSFLVCSYCYTVENISRNTPF